MHVDYLQVLLRISWLDSDLLCIDEVPPFVEIVMYYFKAIFAQEAEVIRTHTGRFLSIVRNHFIRVSDLATSSAIA